MPKVTVKATNTFRHMGNRVLVGDTLEVSELQAERWARIGYAKATKGAAQSASNASPKAAAKKAANAAKVTGRANAAAKKAAKVAPVTTTVSEAPQA